MKLVLKQVLLYAFFILLIAGSYSSFTSLLNYIHKSHGEQHGIHAQLFLVVNSFASIIFNILIPNLKINNLKKLSYLIPASFLAIYLLTYFGFISDSSNVSLVFTLIAALFAGIGSSLIWMISGKYINLACKLGNQRQNEGKYFGIFGSIMACNFFIGAVLSATALQYLSHKHDIYIILAVLSALGIVYCKVLIHDVQAQKKPNVNDTSTHNNEALQNIPLTPTQPKQKWISLDLKFNKTCLFNNLSVYKRTMSMFPFQLLNGLTVGYIFHCTQDLVFAPSKQAKDQFLTITLIFIGCGGVLGAYVSGYLSDRCTSKKLFYVGVLSCLLSFVLGMITLKLQHLLISLITSFISGFAMMYTNNMLVVMCSKCYEGSMMIFATNRQMINVSFMIYNLGIGVIKPENMHSQMYYELFIFIIISSICLYMVRYIRQKRIQENDADHPFGRNNLELNQVQIKMDTDSTPVKKEQDI